MEQHDQWQRQQPPQHQDQQPGIESDMTPRPKAEDRSYRGSGKLRHKGALITGGDSGIGRAVAIMFAKEGADVAIIYLNEHGDAEETKRLVEAKGAAAPCSPEMWGRKRSASRRCSTPWRHWAGSTSW